MSKIYKNSEYYCNLLCLKGRYILSKKQMELGQTPHNTEMGVVKTNK